MSFYLACYALPVSIHMFESLAYSTKRPPSYQVLAHHLLQNLLFVQDLELTHASSRFTVSCLFMDGARYGMVGVCCLVF